MNNLKHFTGKIILNESWRLKWDNSNIINQIKYYLIKIEIEKKNNADHN
jgi:hypothetical protein